MISEPGKQEITIYILPYISKSISICKYIKKKSDNETSSVNRK